MGTPFRVLVWLRRLLNGNYSGEYSPYGALPWDSACQGEDWARNIALPDIDLASLHTYSPTSFNSDPAVIAARVGKSVCAACMHCEWGHTSCRYKVS